MESSAGWVGIDAEDALLRYVYIGHISCMLIMPSVWVHRFLFGLAKLHASFTRLPKLHLEWAMMHGPYAQQLLALNAALTKAEARSIYLEITMTEDELWARGGKVLMLTREWDKEMDRVKVVLEGLAQSTPQAFWEALRLRWREHAAFVHEVLNGGPTSREDKLGYAAQTYPHLFCARFWQWVAVVYPYETSTRGLPAGNLLYALQRYLYHAGNLAETRLFAEQVLVCPYMTDMVSQEESAAQAQKELMLQANLLIEMASVPLVFRPDEYTVGMIHRLARAGKPVPKA